MTPPPAVRDLAERLLTFEAASEGSVAAPGFPALRAYENLRRRIGEFAGVAGFHSLASRALALAKAEAPGLAAARVNTDGSLACVKSNPRDDSQHQMDIGRDGVAGYLAGEAGVILIACLLGLLLTFVGKALTFSVLRATWPAAALEESESENGRKA